jgi:DNA-binding GntR family transcriptional regulator
VTAPGTPPEGLPEIDGPGSLPEGRTLHDELRRRIVGGQIPPGTVLFETTVGRSFGVSRTPVREAFARLVDEGLLTRQGRGCSVTSRTPEEIIEIFEVRAALERAAAELAASRCSEFDLAALEAMDERTNELVRQLGGEPASRAVTDEIQRLNRDWHHRLLRSTKHGFLIRELEYVLDMQATYDHQMPVRGHAGLAGALNDHEDILAALRARDARAAAEAMTAHLAEVRVGRVRQYVAHSELDNPSP